MSSPLLLYFALLRDLNQTCTLSSSLKIFMPERGPPGANFPPSQIYKFPFTV
nr:MAG TPA: hypothetical protein [Caudoviricetes sp.]